MQQTGIFVEFTKNVKFSNFSLSYLSHVMEVCCAPMIYKWLFEHQTMIFTDVLFILGIHRQQCQSPFLWVSIDFCDKGILCSDRDVELCITAYILHFDAVWVVWPWSCAVWQWTTLSWCSQEWSRRQSCTCVGIFYGNIVRWDGIR